MNQYHNAEVIKLLDAPTISALFRLYGINYDSIAFRLRQTRQAIVYKQKHDSWKPYERQLVYELLKQHGLESTELILINKMANTSKKRKWVTSE
ncbi:hypothetical protein ACIQXV_24545 [Neobacillus sp. NPDC097160]|uniref:hypothetical protein n=1 Tax=Neobacillus sp. NPDC097160 TaxID=3364298 RepID=UPI003821DD7F